MCSRSETDAGAKSILAATTTGTLQKRLRFDQNYGAMNMVMSYLPPIQQLRMQGLDKWQYNTGVGRVQVRLVWPEIFFFTDNFRPQVLAISETGESKWFDCRGESDFSNQGWKSCQVGRSRLFQCAQKSFRILQVDHSQRSFTVERQWARPEKRKVLCLTNFNDQFIFLFFQGGLSRYSLTEDRLEKISVYDNFHPISACSLGDIVYIFAFHWSGKNLIHELHNPGASISLQKLHNRIARLPADVCMHRKWQTVFMALNATEVAILGGQDRTLSDWFGDALTFNTSTCELKKELEDKNDPFGCFGNQSAKVSENTIIALVQYKTGENRLIKYRKGDTCVTRLEV